MNLLVYGSSEYVFLDVLLLKVGMVKMAFLCTQQFSAPR